jgi:ABC-type transport system substrate-binding protein
MSQKKIFQPTPIWKTVLCLFLAIISVYIFMFLYSLTVGSSLKQPVQKYTEKEIKEVVHDRKIPYKIDIKPRIAQNIPESQYKESEAFYKKYPKASKDKIEEFIKKGKLPVWYPINEAPVLKKLELSGKFPSVVDRVGPEPVVIKGVDGIGKYGGTWLRAATSANDISIIKDRLAHARLLRFSPMGEPIVPHIAKSCRMLDGGKVWEVVLRKIKWSDGQPVTADDIMFWWNVYTDKGFRESGGNPPAWLMIGGKYGRIEKVNDMTVRFVFPYPYGTFNYQLGKREFIWPSHYLKNYYPKYGDPKFIAKEMKAYRFASPYQLFNEIKKQFINPELPTLNPWILRRETNNAPYVFVRNPYYFVVDEEGNQLPYIDRVQFNIVDGSMMPIAAAQGKMSMQARHISFDNYTEIMSQSLNSNIKMYYWLSGDSSQWLIYPNSNRLVKPGEPVTKWKATLLSDKEFRQALSIAIDRKRIINALYNDLGKPVQIGPDSFSHLHNENF